MSAELPPLQLPQVLRLLYNLPATEEEAQKRASSVLQAASGLPLKQRFSPDRFDPMPRARPPAPQVK